MDSTEKIRCAWVNLKNPLYVTYHDTEWGVPQYDDYKLFEAIILDAAQAGLTWEMILNKRENYRAALDAFDFEIIAQYDELKIAELLNNPGIVRNKLKVRSTVTNAQAFIAIRKEFGSFSSYLWNFVEGKPILNQWKNINEVPAKTELSDTISKDLKKRGFKFVGSTIVYAMIQAVGLVNDHTIDCFRYDEV